MKIGTLLVFAIFTAVAFLPGAVSRIASAQEPPPAQAPQPQPQSQPQPDPQQPIEPIDPCPDCDPEPTPNPTPRPRPEDFQSLKNIPTPEPDNLSQFVSNRAVAIALGKALFWDMQVGSDGVVSCASCHFHAGADSRSVNQLNPGLRGNPPDTTFQTGPVNYQLSAADYPFHRLSDVNNRHSSVLFDSNDVTSSQGVFNGDFQAIIQGNPEDSVFYHPDDQNVFVLNGLLVRRVEPRNTPTVINAVFNFRNFWDGRAQEDFNGVSPFGARDPNAFVMAANGTLVRVSLNKSSLASQAVGPPLSNEEMSGAGRDWPNVGRKMLSLPPLAKQAVAGDDSVLGPYKNPYGNGLTVSYQWLVQNAFQPQWWQNTTHRDTRGFTQIEHNFSLFFGIAVQMYEATLRSDDTPFDRFMEGNDYAMTAQQLDGLDVFTGQGKCNACHSGAEFTKASFRNVVNEKIERMVMGDGGVAVYDNGFYNIGVRPTNEDIGVGGLDPFGNPLSFTRFFQRFGPFPFLEGEDGAPSGPLQPNERAAVDGAFKTAGLRNVELTAPYFHNGGQFSLRQVVDFYNRGGDFHEVNIANLDPDIENLGLSEYQKNALVAFLTALTDERVRYHRAPFDHPSLVITTGHHSPPQGRGDGTTRAVDLVATIQAVGQGGLSAPLANFPAFKRFTPPPDPIEPPCRPTKICYQY